MVDRFGRGVDQSVLVHDLTSSWAFKLPPYTLTISSHLRHFVGRGTGLGRWPQSEINLQLFAGKVIRSPNSKLWPLRWFRRGEGVFRAESPPVQCEHNERVFRKVGYSKLDSVASAVRVGPLQGSLPQSYSNAKDVLAVGRIQRQTGIEQASRTETDDGRGSSDRL